MREPNIFLVFPEVFNQSKLQYMVTGSVAGIIYGEPRITNDIDIVLDIHTDSVKKIIKLFPMDEFYCPSEETIKTEISRETRGHFNIIHHITGFKADIYPAGNDKLHKWAMSRRKQVQIDNVNIWLAPPEYVIIRKLEYYKEGESQKHLRDIKKILQFSSDLIDKPVLKQKIKELGLINELAKAKNFEE